MTDVRLTDKQIKALCIRCGFKHCRYNEEGVLERSFYIHDAYTDTRTGDSWIPVKIENILEQLEIDKC